LAKLTLKRFAREIGLSVGTVSAALRDGTSVKTETAAYVRARAAEMGYRVNPWARRMQSQASGFIDLVLPQRPTNLTNTLTQEIVDLLRREGFTTTVQYISDASEVDLFRAPVDGFILLSEPFHALRERLDAHSLPYLLIDPQPGGRTASGRQGSHSNELSSAEPGRPTILLDRRAAGHEAARLLAERGCERFIFCGNPDGPKFEGYTAGLAEQGVHPNEIRVVLVPGRDEQTGAAADLPIDDMLLAAMERPESSETKAGIWVSSLRTMALILRSCDRQRIRIGSDLLTLYWGAHFDELPGYEKLSFIGEPAEAFSEAILKWAQAPLEMLPEVTTIRMVPQLRESL
jgi:DNA-binding LacI/PurR family transcriptional regulator